MVLHADEQTKLVEWFRQSLPTIPRAICSSGHLLQYPQILRDGWLIGETITTHERLSQLKDVFEAEGIASEINSVTQSAE